MKERGRDMDDNETFVCFIFALLALPVIFVIVSYVTDAFVKAKALDVLVECVKNADHLDAEELADLKKAIAKFAADKTKKED